jgi:hypothetical protein
LKIFKKEPKTVGDLLFDRLSVSQLFRSTWSVQAVS